MSQRRKWAPSFVTVVALTTLGCESTGDHRNAVNPPPPPPPSAEPTIKPPGNPPPPMPSWDAVASGHPEGATNPPSPVLQLMNDGRCFKEWHGGMLAFETDTKPMEVGGKTYEVRVLDAPDGSKGQVTEITCPPGSEEARKAFASDAPTKGDGAKKDDGAL